LSCCKKNSCFCLMLTLFRCPLITEDKHLLRDPELSSVTRNCQIYIMPLDTLQIRINKLKYFMNCIKVKRNNLLNSIYSSVSPDSRFKETPYVYLKMSMEKSHKDNRHNTNTQINNPSDRHYK